MKMPRSTMGFVIGPVALHLDSVAQILKRALVVVAWVALVTAAWGQNPPRLWLAQPTLLSNGWARLYAEAKIDGEPQVITVRVSTNLTNWSVLAVLPGVWFWDPEQVSVSSNRTRFQYQDRSTANSSARFYQGLVGSSQGWRNQIFFDDDDFAVWMGDMAYVKFVIPADDPTRVLYFSGGYLFHFDFITNRLEAFRGLSLEEVRARTRYNEGRQLFTGTVLFPWNSVTEYGIQFDSTDPLPPETVQALFDLVSSTVINGRESNAPPFRAFYVPSYEQIPVALSQVAFYESNRIALATMDRWVAGDISYAPGWAVGRLVFVPGTNIMSAYASGELLGSDILLTDGVPADVPYVAGIVALSPATPNSHVAILARSYGLPFVYLSKAEERERARLLDGQEVYLWAVNPNSTESWWPRAKLLVLDPDLDPVLKQELLALKQTQPIHFPAKERFGAYTAATEVLWPADIRFFGGKAANFGLLRRTIPTNSPDAIAFSMDLWDDFMDQTLGNGRSLRAEIASRLSGFTTNPVNIVALTNTLEGIRDLIRQTATFNPAQRQAILNALARFEPARKIRFRSSTNVEDSESFSGAGLYDSYSGCLADDLDADTRGPCRCDATENNERGVFRAIQRVYASFYNDNAYLVRLQQGIDETTVGMGVLVHYSTPDEIELANGVATVAVVRQEPHPTGYDIEMVTQLGAVSVANPDGTAVPEVLRSAWSDCGDCLALEQPSSLVPLSSYVLDWPSYSSNEYRSFARMFTNVAGAYAQVFPDKRRFTLDFEYKKVAPGHLEVKQVREVPTPDTTPSIAPFLFNEPITLVSHQGIMDDFFQTHRLKSRWVIRSRNLRLTQTNAAQGILADITWERAHNGVIETYTGPLTALSNATYHGGIDTTGGWTAMTADGPARYQLQFSFFFPAAPFLTSVQQPVYTLADAIGWILSAEYDRALPYLGGYRTNESVWLWRAREPGESDARFDYTFVVTNGTSNIVIQTAYWLDSPNIYTGLPSLIGNINSRIEGLTTETIVLNGFFSQTFEADHFLWSERFIFEPRVEPGISQAILDELRAADIRLLVFTHRDNIPRLRVMGFDGRLRDWGVPAPGARP
ncbi:MAG: hypothetical protein HZA90_26780 [Verrucomicrobia bacterium]|nr:hypothetical protein [Verrucomicrobiota bacterium]